MVNIGEKYAIKFESGLSTGGSQRTNIQVGDRQDNGAGIYFNGPTNSNGDYNIGVKSDQVFYIAPGLNDIGDTPTKMLTINKDFYIEGECTKSYIYKLYSKRFFKTAGLSRARRAV